MGTFFLSGVSKKKRWPLTELTELAGSLRRELGLHVGATFVNGLLEEGLPRFPELREYTSLDDPAAALGDDRMKVLFTAVERIAERAEYQQREVATWLAAAEGGSGRDVVYLPWMPEGVERPEVLRRLADAVDVERSPLAEGLSRVAVRDDAIEDSA